MCEPVKKWLKFAFMSVHDLKISFTLAKFISLKSLFLKKIRLFSVYQSFVTHSWIFQLYIYFCKKAFLLFYLLILSFNISELLILFPDFGIYNVFFSNVFSRYLDGVKLLLNSNFSQDWLQEISICRSPWWRK